MIIGGLILLAGASIVLTAVVVGKYEHLVKENVDSGLSATADTVDKMLKNNLEKYRECLRDISESEALLEGEQLLAETGEGDLWIKAVQNSILGDQEEIQSVFLMSGEKILLSTSTNNYHFPAVEKEHPVRPCIGEEGQVYLAFLVKTERNLQYACLIDAQSFFEELSEGMGKENDVQVIVEDYNGQMLVQCRNNGVMIERISDMTAEHSGFPLLSALEEPDGKELLNYAGASQSTGEAYEGRMVVLPVSQTRNGSFRVAVSVDYDRALLSIKTMEIFLGAVGCLFVFGSAGLLYLLWKMSCSSQEELREIQILKEKNKAMEELNHQTQNLAHHQRLEIMGILTSGIAHEFNNLLTPIMGYSMMILEKLPQDDTELYDEVLEIYQMSSKAKTVISRLSDLSGKNSTAAFQSVSLDELVRRMISAAKSARPNGVDVQLELKCPEDRILGNETQLSQMLLNMILNSYHALEDKGGTLEVLTERRESDLILTIKDNGYGISKENLEHIFEPFFTTKEAGKGTGLGMAIVAQVVEDHHGKITVESVEREGTVMTVKFPILNKY